MPKTATHVPPPATVEIERLGFTHDLIPQYDLSKLDPSSGRRAQVRDEKNYAPKEGVERFAVQMTHVEFPPIVVTNDGWVVDGNTRIGAAAKRGLKFFPAYVLDIAWEKATENQRNDIRILGATLNAQNGQPLTPAEARRNTEACLARGWKVEQICRALGLKAAQVVGVKKEMDARAKLELAGTNGIKGPALRALGEKTVLGLNNDPFKALAVLTAEAGLNAAEIRDLAKEASTSGSDEAAVARLQAAHAEMTERIRQHKLTGGGGPSLASQLKTRLAWINKFAGTETELIELNPVAIPEYVENLRTAVGVLQGAIDAHPVPAETGLRDS